VTVHRQRAGRRFLRTAYCLLPIWLQETFSPIGPENCSSVYISQHGINAGNDRDRVGDELVGHHDRQGLDGGKARGAAMEAPRLGFSD
jgi:hypothetical protein